MSDCLYYMCVEGVTVFLVASKKSWIGWLTFRKESLCSVVWLTILNVADFEGGVGNEKLYWQIFRQKHNYSWILFQYQGNFISKFQEIKLDSLIFLGHLKKILKANNFASDYFRIVIQSTT